MDEDTEARVRPDSLDAVRSAAFALLAEGVAEPRSPFRGPALATMDRSGRPAVRTVILRRFAPEARRLSFHTDRRSAKYAELAARPAVALHVWDAARKVQLRLDGDAGLHVGDAVARALWDGAGPGSRAGYRQATGPGRPLPAPSAPDSLPRDEGAAFGDFVAVEIVFHCLDWLALSRHGNRRARFSWQGGGCDARWIAP